LSNEFLIFTSDSLHQSKKI